MIDRSSGLLSALSWPRFDFSKVRLSDISERGHKLLAQDVNTDLSGEALLASLAAQSEVLDREDPLSRLARSMRRAKGSGYKIVWFLGGHPIKLGLSPFLIDLIRLGWVSHLAVNGAFALHDFELATVGGTSEDVTKHLPRGRFGLWTESSRFNEVVRRLPEIVQPHVGLGAAVGLAAAETGDRADLSVLAACLVHDVPATVHLAVGQDITHTHANFGTSGLLEASYVDFSIFCSSVGELGSGVFLNVGTAVAGPEVFLKALSAARNVVGQNQVVDFDTAVFDLTPVGAEQPTSDVDPAYYFRPWKTVLSRAVQGQGRSFYVNMDHRDSLPLLWHLLTR